MCLAVPARLMTCRGSIAMADLSGNRVEINTLLVPHCKKGDWVLLHGGYAIQTLSELDVQATWVLASDSHHEGAKP